MVRRRLGDQSPHLLQRDRLADKLAVALPLIPILVGLIIPSERPVDQLDFGQPFDGRHGIPARNDEAQRIAVLNGQGLAIHRIGQQQVRVASLIKLETALEPDRS